ncbi:MAG: error-prone DNA polymerase [Nocardioides sp.]
MGWNNPEIAWRDLERRLSGRPDVVAPDDPRGDAPISRRKHPRLSLPPTSERDAVPYVELHAHSHFSFLDGASSPAALAREAIRLGLTGLAITDHDGFYAAPYLAEAGQAAAAAGSPLLTVYGAELSLDLTRPQAGNPDPEGRHLLVLARGVDGYRRLAGVMTEAHLRGGEKGKPVYDLGELLDAGRGRWQILTGCRKGFRTPDQVRQLIDWFGAEAVTVELTDHGHPGDSRENRRLAGLAGDLGLATVATGNIHYARPEEHRLADAMAAVRARRALSEIAGWLPAAPSAHLRSGAEMTRLFSRHPGAVARSVQIAEECAFDLTKAKPRLPKHGIPEGHTAASWLRELTERGFAVRYVDAYADDPAFIARARARVERELRTIAEKDFDGYFVIVHDIVEFARSQAILCQGRGSAAASAVCYALGITAIDPVFYNLPFERFISINRTEEPDIDVDFDADRREEVIQWVYERYGRRNAAQVANIIGYRPKMAVRDAAKALGFSPGQQDAWSKQMSSWTTVESPEGVEIPAAVLELARSFHGAPRHLGIHSGGMVLTEEPVGQVVPIEPARMDRRTVLQWDKDGCELMGLVKFDLLGLGMLAAIDHTMAMTRDHLGEPWTLAGIPKEEPAVYDMLCRADSIGVFQVESRAQIGTLPRLRPRCFYDLAIEIALIRPGPVQGGAVHPYIRRATGKDPISYAHPLLEPVLQRTRGVPLFQEQLMEMGTVLGGLSADEADLLRRAMGSKRGIERIESLKERLFTGMLDKGMDPVVAGTVYTQILSFANFGFAESHSLSFAKLVYASSWLKLHYPGAFLAGLLRAQPMGFYSPASLVADARRHAVVVLGPDLALSGATAGLEPLAASSVVEPGPAPVGPGGTVPDPACLRDHGPEPVAWVPGTPDPTPAHRRDGGFAVRLGLDSVRGIGPDLAKRIVAEREKAGAYVDPVDLSRRAGLTSAQLEALATAGALGADRRKALWSAGWTEAADHLPGTTPAVAAPDLPAMGEVETTLADLWATGIVTGDHPVAQVRPLLAGTGIRSVADLAGAQDARRLSVAGLITHRQRPGTAGGVTFINLEDETGMLNVVCTAGMWKRYRQVAVNNSAVVIRGILERQDGALSLVADRIASLAEVHAGAAQALDDRHRSRDFR